MNKKILLFVALVGAIISVVFYIIVNNYNQDRGVSIEDRISSTIASRIPMLSSGGTPVFAIDSISSHGSWHIAKIKSLKETRRPVPVIAILNELDDTTLNIVLGPDTHFTETELLRNNVPDSVILELQK